MGRHKRLTVEKSYLGEEGQLILSVCGMGFLCLIEEGYVYIYIHIILSLSVCLLSVSLSIYSSVFLSVSRSLSLSLFISLLLSPYPLPHSLSLCHFLSLFILITCIFVHICTPLYTYCSHSLSLNLTNAYLPPI